MQQAGALRVLAILLTTVPNLRMTCPFSPRSARGPIAWMSKGEGWTFPRSHIQGALPVGSECGSWSSS